MAATTKLDPRRALSVPWIYEAFQRLVGKDKLRRKLVDEYLRPRQGDLVVDIGCGPGDLLRFLPDVRYIGFDVDEDYIRAARARFPEATFHCGDIEEFESEVDGPADLVVAVGVLHHVDDAEAIRILEFARRTLGPGGRFVAAEPHLHDDQGRVSRTLVKNDRGRHVRSAPEYERLCRKVFETVESRWDGEMFHIPYSKVVLECAT